MCAMRSDELLNKNIYVPFTIFHKAKKFDEEGNIISTDDHVSIKDVTSVQFEKVKSEFGQDFDRIKDLSINLKINEVTPIRLYEYEQDYGYIRLLYMTYTDKINVYHPESSLYIEEKDKIDIICLDNGTDKLYSSDPSIFLVSDVVSLGQEFEKHVGLMENVFEDGASAGNNNLIELESLLEGNLPEFEIFYMDSAHEIHDLHDVAVANYQHFKKLVDYNHLEAVFRQFDYACPSVFKRGEFSWHNLFMKYIQEQTKNLTLN
jgi:hypothetical protein